MAKEVNYMSKSECLQLKTGSCMGCSVLEIVLRKGREGQVDDIAKRVGKSLCPEGMRPRAISKPKRKMW